MANIKYDMEPLNEKEQQRLVEIKFYVMIKLLLETFNYSAGVFEVIGTLAQLYGNNPSILKYLIQSMKYY